MRRYATLITLCTVLFAAVPAAANPRYSSRVGQKCLLCHEDPGGGGMRSAYAAEYLLPDEIAMRPYDETSRALLEHALSKSVTVGADMRTLATYSDKRKTDNDFFAMQGDVYLHFRLDPRFSVYFDRGISGSYEVFGTAFVLPGSGYFKIGRFVPPYGWKIEDHTAFVRETLGYFTPPANTDVGLEVGILPGGNSISLAVMNGAPGSVRDTDGKRIYLARAERRTRFGPVRTAVGGSWLQDEAGRIADWTGGPFASISWGPYTWVGECDWQRRDVGQRTTAFATSHELSRRIVQGLDLLATYDFHDPDLDRKTGARRRIGLGLDSLIYPFLGVLAKENWHDFDGGVDVAGEDYFETQVLFHFLY
jgi:hypothetical protein